MTTRLRLENIKVTVGPRNIPILGPRDGEYITIQPRPDNCGRCRSHPTVRGGRCWRCGDCPFDNMGLGQFAAINHITRGAAIAAMIEYRCTPSTLELCVDRITAQDWRAFEIEQ